MQDPVQIICGCVLDELPLMEAESVHMCATSPPYYGLRSYDGESSDWPAVSYAPMAGLAKIEIPGCDPDCDHQWGETGPDHHPGQVEQTKWKNATAAGAGQTAGSGQFCQRCGGWRGQLGLELSPEMYVGHLVTVFRLVRRVLRDDGTLWLNLGDSFASPGKGGPRDEGRSKHSPKQTVPGYVYAQQANRGPLPGFKAKDLIGIPWRVAFALQADGWWLRSEIIWHKPNPMPESVRDRPTRAHEQVFLLTKKAKYYYDHIAIQEKAVKGAAGSSFTNGKTGEHQQGRASTKKREESLTRNLRSVWTINPEPQKHREGTNHYSAWPTRLVAPMIRAGTSERGVCGVCGSPYERVVEKVKGEVASSKGSSFSNGKTAEHQLGRASEQERTASTKTTGWRPTCRCEVGEPVPATVFDPFMGTGTTLETARRLGRYAIGIDRAGTYVSMARERTAQQNLF